MLAAVSYFSSADFARVNNPSTPTKRLSRTEQSSATSTSWNTVATPASLASRGVEGAWPSTETWPLSIGSTPEMTLASVLLPQPLPPTMAWISPSRAAKEQPSSARVTPKDLRASWTVMSA